METLIIEIPENKSTLVKSLLKELGVVIHKQMPKKSANDRKPNATTVKVIEDARNGIGIGEPIVDIKSFIDSL
ncbi:MAG: hypothetical protein EOO98_01545 [Pedobacter sp.]|nr:MAG: hypothetical protein EOO98_01545 [Pedobacter sp.]